VMFAMGSDATRLQSVNFIQNADTFPMHFALRDAAPTTTATMATMATTTQRTTLVATAVVRAARTRGRRNMRPMAVRAAIFGFGRGGARDERGNDARRATHATTTTTEVNADAVARLERAVAMEQQARPVAGGKEPVKRRTAVMAGNWKLNPKTMDEARTLAALVGAAAREDKAPGVKTRECEVFVCPPSPFISEVSRIVSGVRRSIIDAGGWIINSIRKTLDAYLSLFFPCATTSMTLDEIRSARVKNKPLLRTEAGLIPRLPLLKS